MSNSVIGIVRLKNKVIALLIAIYVLMHFANIPRKEILYLADIFIGLFGILFFIWGVSLRSFMMRRSIGLPFREGAKKANEGAAISVSSRIAEHLRPRKDKIFIEDGSVSLRFIDRFKILRTIFHRPYTWSATNLFALAAKVHYRESTGRNFLDNPEAMNNLSALFLRLDDAILHDKYTDYCHFMAEYYSLLRKPKRTPILSRELDNGEITPGVKEHIERIRTFINQSDYFGAYCDILQLDEDDVFLKLRDKEKLAITYLICRLGNQVHGSEYLVTPTQVDLANKDLLYRIDLILASLSMSDSQLFLRAVA